MRATGIPLRHLHLAWPDLWPLLEPAVARTPDYLQAQPGGGPDVLARLIARDAQLWAIYDDGRPIAAVVTQITLDAAGKRCRLWLIGACPEAARRGSRLRAWADELIDKIEPWARALGCVALWGSGREGWARIVNRMGGKEIGTIAGFPAWERRL
jgi:hypothetical protein